MGALCTPTHFRPEHFKAAVEAGKHLLMVKPCAVIRWHPYGHCCIESGYRKGTYRNYLKPAQAPSRILGGIYSNKKLNHW